MVSYKPSSLDIILAEMKTISGITKQKRDTFHFLYSSLQSLFLSIPRWCFVGKRDSVLPLWWWCSCCSERPMNQHRHRYRPNLEVQQGSPNHQTFRFDQLNHGRINLLNKSLFWTYQKMLDQNLEAKNCRLSFCNSLMVT